MQQPRSHSWDWQVRSPGGPEGNGLSQVAVASSPSHVPQLCSTWIFLYSSFALLGIFLVRTLGIIKYLHQAVAGFYTTQLRRLRPHQQRCMRLYTVQVLFGQPPWMYCTPWKERLHGVNQVRRGVTSGVRKAPVPRSNKKPADTKRGRKAT